jgi:hypothetical protein
MYRRRLSAGPLLSVIWMAPSQPVALDAVPLDELCKTAGVIERHDAAGRGVALGPSWEALVEERQVYTGSPSVSLGLTRVRMLLMFGSLAKWSKVIKTTTIRAA